jgi:probable HAF family extracellular repeat protein
MAGARAQQASYTQEPIAAPAGTYSIPTAINQSGQVAGVSVSTGSDAMQTAFIWTHSGGLVSLGTLPGGMQSWADGINKSGQVVGRADGTDGNWHAFVWSQSNGMADLGVLPGGSYSEAWAINDSGQVVGYGDVATGNWHAFVWSQSTGMVDIGALPGRSNAEAVGINNNGQVVGVSGDENGEWHAFTWTSAKGMVDIGLALPSIWSPSVAINNQGQIAGWTVDAKSYSHLFLWSQTSERSVQGFSFAPGQGLGIDYTPGVAINNLGEVCGNAGYSSDGKPFFVWTKATGKMVVSANVVFNPPSITPAGISPTGAVVGLGAQVTGSTGFAAYPYTLAISPGVVNAGNSARGTITLPFASTTDTTVKLTSGNSAVAVPATVTIPAGKTAATFSISTKSAAANSITRIAAQLSVWAIHQSLMVPSPVKSVALSANSVVADGRVTGTVTLAAAAVAPTTVTLASSGTAASVPATVVVPQGATTANFRITTNYQITSDASVSITAGSGGASASASLTVQAENITGVTLTPNAVTGGGPVEYVAIAVTMSHPAPDNHAPIVLTGQTAVAPFPATTYLETGKAVTGASFNAGIVTSPTQITVTATSGFNGSSASAVVTILPNYAFTVSASPTKVMSGGTSTFTVTLGSPAPAGGLTFALTSGHPDVAVFAVPTLTIPAGQTTGTVTVNTLLTPVDRTLTLLASIGTTQKGVKFDVTPIYLSTLSVSSTTLVSGQTATGTVTLIAPAPADLQVRLTSDNAAVTVPAAVTVRAGQTSATFTVTTNTVSKNTAATVAASYGGNDSLVHMTITP